MRAAETETRLTWGYGIYVPMRLSVTYFHSLRIPVMHDSYPFPTSGYQRRAGLVALQVTVQRMGVAGLIGRRVIRTDRWQLDT